MPRYKAAVGPETEFEPGSHGRVLRNLMGIKSKTAMDEVEAMALERAQGRYIQENVVDEKTKFTARLIRQMHADWLGGIYEWAGRYRSVEMSKGRFTFPPAYLITDNMVRFEHEVLRMLTPCRPGPLSKICKAVATVHADLLLIHPFREGNGRLVRWIANTMLAQAGLTMPDYGFVGKGSRLLRKAYLGAVIKGYGGDYLDLSRFFEGAVLRGNALDLSLESARGDAPSKAQDS